MNRPIQRLSQLNLHDPATIGHLAEHVCDFSLGGIRVIAEGSAGRSKKISASGQAHRSF